MNKSTYDKLTLEAQWIFSDGSGQSLGNHMFALLQAVEESGKLTAAAKMTGMSYRHAWNQLQQWEAFFGVALVELQKGKGARLSSFGEKLLWAKKRVDAKIEPELENIISEINLQLRDLKQDDDTPLRINASHGYAVALLTEHIQSPSLKLRFTSAEDALRSLAADECDLAGFHVPENGSGLQRIHAFDHYLNEHEYGLIRFIQRKQGLILAAGNPHKISSLQDLSLQSVKFVNRQHNSGTRFLLDQFLQQQNLSPDQINGYTSEEFTHSAVAAHIAAGMAGAGFGVEQAARQFGLDFIALCREEYLFAYKKDALNLHIIKQFQQQLCTMDIQEAIKALSGYSPTACGEDIEFSEIASWT